MLPSIEREYKEKIKQAEHKATEQHWLGIAKCVGVVNRANFLTLEQKEMLTELFKK